ncbi:hypothetical protein LB506_006740, partial [Fusarium annulatum]
PSTAPFIPRSQSIDAPLPPPFPFPSQSLAPLPGCFPNLAFRPFPLSGLVPLLSPVYPRLFCFDLFFEPIWPIRIVSLRLSTHSKLESARPSGKSFSAIQFSSVHFVLFPISLCSLHHLVSTAKSTFLLDRLISSCPWLFAFRQIHFSRHPDLHSQRRVPVKRYHYQGAHLEL